MGPFEPRLEDWYGAWDPELHLPQLTTCMFWSWKSLFSFKVFRTLIDTYPSPPVQTTQCTRQYESFGIQIFHWKTVKKSIHSFEAFYVLTPQKLITATIVMATEKTREKRSCWLDKFHSSQTLHFQAITKHYGWYLEYRRQGSGKTVGQNTRLAAEFC